MSDWEDVCEESGFTANDDGDMLLWIDSNELLAIQRQLRDDYNIILELEDITDIMAEHGIDIGFSGEYPIADLIYEKEFSDGDT